MTNYSYRTLFVLVVVGSSLSFAIVQTGAQSAAAAPGGSLKVTIKVKAKRDVPIPAEEEGVLREIPVVEGNRVRAGDLLAQIDVRRALAAAKVAELQHEIAKKRSEDDVEKRYAQKAAGVAYVDWQRDVEANITAPNAVPDIQIRQKRLVFEKSELQIEKAEKDQVLAAKEAEAKLAEFEAARLAVDMRTIVAPFDGEVVTLFKQQSQWASPSDPILRLVQFDVLYAEGFVKLADYDPSELRGKPVTVDIALARGRKDSVQGRVTYVSPVVDGNEQYLVRAEITNKQVEGEWLVRLGIFTDMHIAL